MAHPSMPADPTYPLYPVANIISAALLLLVLLSRAIRRSWSLGLTFLCFWLFLEALIDGIGGIVWSDNADVKLYVYCDITSRVQLVSLVVKSMATFILMRRLYKIASLQSMEMRTVQANRQDLILEWALGFGIPATVAGPLYYIVEFSRFQLVEGFGCTNAVVPSVLSILLFYIWGIVPPILCVILYYPRVVRVFYQHSKSIRRFRNGSASPFHTTYFRILAIASIDIILTLPIGIANVVLIIASLPNQQSLLTLPFYQGWVPVHKNFHDLVTISYEQLARSGPYTLPQVYFTYATTPVLALSIFGLFGLTREARESYCRAWDALSDKIGWRHRAGTLKRDASDLESLEFDVPQRAMTLDTETGSFSAFV